MALKKVDISFLTQSWIGKTAVILERFLPLWVALAIVIGLVSGYYLPHSDWVNRLVTVFVITILYPMMINIRIKDFTKAVRNIKLLASAWFISFVLSPLMGVLWGHIIFKNSDAYITVGFVLVTIMPCGALMASWTGYARGSVESAVAIIGSSLLLSIIMVPLWLYIFANTYINIDLRLILQKLGLVIILPLLGGQLTRTGLVREYGVKNYQRLVPILPSLSLCGMICTLVCTMIANSKIILSSREALPLIVVGLLTLYPLLFLLALAFGRIAHLPYSDAIALAYGVTSRNMPLAVAVATTAFTGTLAVLSPSFGPIVQIPTMILILKLSSRIKTIFKN